MPRIFLEKESETGGVW